MNVMEFKDYYDVLGVKRDAGFREIKIAYRNLSKRYHPDVNEGDAESKERFIEIQEAYRKLSYRYKKNKNTNNLQYDFYYSELSKTGKILPRFKLLANSTTETFIPPAAKRSYGFIWIMLAAIAVLMFLYYKTTSYYPVQYNPAEFSGFRLPALPAKSVVSATHDTAEAANKARQEQSFSNMDSSTAQKTTAHIIDSNQLSNQKIAARVPLGNQETKRVFSPANLLSFNSHDQLVSTFGTDVIKKTIYTSINGLKNKCSVLFAEPGKKIFFIWKDPVHFRMLKFIKTEEDNVNKLEKVKRSIIGK